MLSQGTIKQKLEAHSMIVRQPSYMASGPEVEECACEKEVALYNVV